MTEEQEEGEVVGERCWRCVKERERTEGEKAWKGGIGENEEKKKKNRIE